MKAYDFEYDGVRLSDLGYVICKFGSSGTDTISNGSVITINTISTMGGNKYERISSEYSECLTATFQICKDICLNTNYEISVEEMRNIMMWLNRKDFHKFKLLNDEFSGIYLEASFNVSRIEVCGRLCGFELEMITNRPFALHEPVVLTIENIAANKVTSFFSDSDESGYIYPHMEITVGSKSGNLEIKSITENRTMSIKNCVAGEVITLDYPIIQTSSTSHKIMNDFNWIFYRIATSFKNKENEFTTSLPCSIKIEYSPIVKVNV